MRIKIREPKYGERLRQILSRTRSLGYPARLLGSTAIVLVAVLIEGLGAEVFSHRPFFLFMAAVTICSLVFESLSGLYALALSLIALLVFSRGGVFSLNIETGDAATIFVFAVASVIVVAVSELVRTLVDSLDEANEAKAVRMRELRHRIKNHLQILVAEVDLEADEARQEETKASLERLSRRIMGVARIIQILDEPDRAGLFYAPRFFDELLDEMSASLLGERNITIRHQTEAVGIDYDDAEVVGVIANELVTNALKYAFPDGRGGAVQVEFARCSDGKKLRLTISDDGVGCSPAIKKGVGLGLVFALAKLRGGGVEFHNASPGCRVVVTLQAAHTA